MRNAPWQLRIAFLVGAVVLVAGIAWSVHASRSSFGWFAYAPLAEDQTLPRFVSNQELAGWALAVTGLVLVVGCGGYVFGRRSASTTMV